MFWQVLGGVLVAVYTLGALVQTKVGQRVVVTIWDRHTFGKDYKNSSARRRDPWF